MLPATIKVAPKSPSARAKASTMPAASPRQASGSVTEQNTESSFRPSSRATSSSAGSTASNAPRAGSRNSGNAATAEATTAPDQWKTSVIPSVCSSQCPSDRAPAQKLEQVETQHRRRQDERQDQDARRPAPCRETASEPGTSASGRPTATISSVASDATRSESQKGPRSLIVRQAASSEAASVLRKSKFLQDALPLLAEDELRERFGFGRSFRGTDDAQRLDDRVVERGIDLDDPDLGDLRDRPADQGGLGISLLSVDRACRTDSAMTILGSSRFHKPARSSACLPALP